MRKLIAVILLSAAALTTQAASRQPPKAAWQQSDQAQHTEAAAKDAKQDERGTAQSPLVINPLVIKTVPQKSDEEAAAEKKDRREHARTDRWTIGIGIATIVILIIQAIVFAVQAKRLRQTIGEMKTATAATDRVAGAVGTVAQQSSAAAEKAAAIATDTLITTNRPWLLISEPEHLVDKGPVIRNGLFELPVKVKIKNVGESPALNIYLFGVTIFDFTDTTIADLLIEWVEPIANFAISAGKGETLFHKDSTEMKARTNSGTKIPAGISVADQDQPWFLLVAASYKFSFSDPKPRYTATLYKVDKRATALITYESSPETPPDGHKFLSGRLSFKKIGTYAS